VTAAPPSSRESTARECADSIYRYIDRTAIAEPSGFRWLEYDNNQEKGKPSIYFGEAGISLFLADYHRLTGTGRAAVLAKGALDWSSAESLWEQSGPDLIFGYGGMAWAWLHWAQGRQDREGIDRAVRIAERVAANATKASEWGTCTDLIGGVAGDGLLFLRVWRTTGEPRWLESAVGLGRWLAERKMAVEGGVAWYFFAGGADKTVFWGAAHGLAGIAVFISELYEATRAEEWRELATACVGALEHAAVEDHGGLNWNRGPGMEPVSRCQWCHGSPGVGLFMVKAARVLDQPRLLGLAERAGDAVIGYGDCRKNPSLCHGLAGNAELLIDLYRATGKAKWLEAAGRFGEMIGKYRVEEGGQEAWQSDEPGFTSPNLLCGAAGTGHFLLQLMTAGKLPRVLP
jgi:lantibiotic modifying enzyme